MQIPGYASVSPKLKSQNQEPQIKSYDIRKFKRYLKTLLRHEHKTRESNRLKYRSGSGSRNFIFNGSVPVQDFKNLGSGSVRFAVAPKCKGSVRVHQNQIFKVQVRFRFTKSKF